MDTERSRRERAFFDDLVDARGDLWWGSGTAAGRRRMARRGQLAWRAVRPSEHPRILEIGCGTGEFSVHLLKEAGQLKLFGCDISSKALCLARDRKPGLVPAMADSCHLPFRNGVLDAVVGNSILHHVPLMATLVELWRVLCPGGTLWFSEPNMLNPQIALEKNVSWLGRRLQTSPDETAFFRWSVAASLRNAGFGRIHVAPFDFLHPLVPRALIRLAEGLGSIAERIPLLREIAGSLCISATKPLE